MRYKNLKRVLLLLFLFFTLIHFVNITSKELLNLQYLIKEDPKAANNAFTLSSNKNWTPNGVIICNASTNQYLPQICGDGSGRTFITWHDSDFTIWVQIVESNGTAKGTYGLPVCIYPFQQKDPKICSDENGGAIITWADNRNGVGYDIYAQKIDSNGFPVWTDLFDGGISVIVKPGDQINPEIISDGAGGAIITWEDYYNTSNCNIVSQRINSYGDRDWSTSGESICSADGHQLSPRICSDNIGGAIITWQDFRNGNNDIYGNRINLMGFTMWNFNGLPICNVVNEQINPQICSDESKGAIITWEDSRSGVESDIYSQKINVTGHPQWIDNGTILCNASDNQHSPQICSDKLGGAIITWEDFRNGLERDIYAQKVNTNCNTIWKNNGIAVNTAEGDQKDPRICSDEEGGAIIAWTDWRDGPDTDIYAQGISTSGVIKGNKDGEIICNAAQTQRYQKICSDGSGGAVVTWIDYRNVTNSDIYAQWIKVESPAPPTYEWMNLIIFFLGLVSVIIVIGVVTNKIIKRKKKIRPSGIIGDECDHLQKKIPKYRGKSLTSSDFMRFVFQFREDLREEALHLFRHIEYFSQEKMQFELIRLIENLDIMSKNVYLVILKGFTLKSSGAWSYFTLKSQKIELEDITSKKLIEKLKKIKDDKYYHFIFLDDVIGTGVQFVNRFKRELGDLLKEKINRIINSNNKIHFHLVAGVGSTQSRINISKQIKILPRGEIKFAKTIKPLDKAFNPENAYNKTKFESLIAFLKKTHPDHWSGFGDSQYLVVTEWNIPDNTIGCLWKKEKNWKPLFPRKSPSRV